MPIYSATFPQQCSKIFLNRMGHGPPLESPMYEYYTYNYLSAETAFIMGKSTLHFLRDSYLVK